MSCDDGATPEKKGTASASGSVQDTTICSVVGRPSEFDNRMIKVRAHVITDGIHNTALIDRRCPTVGVALSLDPAALNASSLTEVISGRRRSPRAEIQAVVVGRFRDDRGWRWLEVSNVLEVTITPREDHGDSRIVAQNLTGALYLQPLKMYGASIRIETVRVATHALVVRVYGSSARNAPEILTVDVVRVGSHLQYISAKGAALTDSPVDESERRRRIATAADILRAFSGYSTDGKHHGVRPGFIEMRFVHPQPPSYLSGTATAVFARDSGLLVMFGTPTVPPGE